MTLPRSFRAASGPLAVAIVLAHAGFARCFAQGLRGFGTPAGKSALPGFGDPLMAERSLRRQFPKLAAALTDADRENAAREIRTTDLNGDGIVTKAEWLDSGFQPV